MSLLSRESSQPLTEQLAQRFVARMRDQLLVSGARLPSVRQCAQMHGVSASTVVAVPQVATMSALPGSSARAPMAAAKRSQPSWAGLR